MGILLVVQTPSYVNDAPQTAIWEASAKDFGRIVAHQEVDMVSVPHVRAAGSPRSEERPGEPDDDLGGLALFRVIGSMMGCPSRQGRHIRGLGVIRPSGIGRRIAGLKPTHRS